MVALAPMVAPLPTCVFRNWFLRLTALRGLDEILKLKKGESLLDTVHTLDAIWSPGIKLNSKTGATTIESGESVSWLVGQLTVDKRELTFASAIWRSKGGVDTLDATRLAIQTLVDRGVLKKPAR